MSDFTAGALIFVGLVVFFGGWHLIDLARHPKSSCRCQGGRIYSRWSRRWRDCPQCGGTGVRDRRKR